MIATRQSRRHLRWYHWTLAVLALLYLTYIALSYLYLPGKLKDIVQDDGSRLLGRRVTVERIAFNPFTLALTVRGLAIAGPQRPLMSWDRLFVNFDAWGSLLGKQARFSALELDAPRIAVERRVQGFNFSDILKRLSKPAAAAPAKKSKPLALKVDDIRLRDGRFRFEDITGTRPARSVLRHITVHVRDLYLATGERQLTPFHVQAAMPGGGLLRVDGQYRADPLRVQANIAADDIHLDAFSSFVESRMPLKLNGGRLTLKTAVDVSMSDSLQVRLPQSKITLTKLAVDTRSGKTVVQWNALNIDQLRLDLAKRRLSIDKVVLEGPDIAARRDADKKIHPAAVMKPASDTGGAAHGPAEPPRSRPPWQVAVGTVQLQHGTIRFTDASMKPVFKSRLHALTLKIDRLTSAGPKPADFSVQAKVNRNASFTVKGTLAPLQRQPEFAFTSRLQGFEMPTLSPYTGTYIGYKLKSGTLGLYLKYDLKRHALKGKNGIVASQLYLGDEVKSDKALKLPIGLGLALLRDADGVIDLNVGVSGNTDDPSFSVSGIIFKALKNIIVKAATAPFRFLASLVGGSEDMGRIEFAAGTSTLNPDNRLKLRQVSEALTKRPQLVVTVAGCAGQAADDAALQMQRVLKRIAEWRKIPVSHLQPKTLLQDKANRKALQGLNARLKLPDEGERKKAVSSAHPDLKGNALTQRVYRNMLDDVATHQGITRQDRLALADQRALAIKGFLVESAGLADSRIQMRKTTDGDLKGRICSLGLQPH